MHSPACILIDIHSERASAMHCALDNVLHMSQVYKLTCGANRKPSAPNTTPPTTNPARKLLSLFLLSALHHDGCKASEGLCSR
jgi:hypothetical protein